MSSAPIAIMPNGLVTPELDFSSQQIKMIQHAVMPGATALEFDLFINLCKVKRLDPLTKQIYAVKYGKTWQTFASIDGLRVIAERSGKYGGQTEPWWCDADGNWRDIWLEEHAPSGAKVGVWKQGYEHPTWGVATLRSYGLNKGGNWQTMPDVMLAKCAEAIALRKAFPDDLSALYVREEFAEAEESVRPVRRQESSPVRAEDVNQDTGEIETPESIAADMKEAREALGWLPADVQRDADREGINLRTIQGLAQMRDRLQSMVTADEQRDMGIEAGFAVAGEPGNDRYS